MVAKSDPTLMFINSGMAPLKDFFLGNQAPPSKRVADTQKCLRVSGKHNDLEDVGFDGYHHTMFEMLGNWSFGDYFKKDALAWSWELLTEKYGLPKDRLYVSVFAGDEAQNLPFDQEAFDTWKQFVAEDRILPFGKKENFWEMGDQGPCGPCSEIHIDLRTDAERARVDGKALVNADDPNVIEIWNNVFMQFNRKADGSLEELPAKSVDTGMGFERLCRAVQGVRSNYDTDLWTPLIGFLEKFSGIAYTGTYPGIETDWKKTDVAMRVVADHLRAVSFAIADGALPSNTGAGYVIRRILRRAVRYYYSFLNLKEPVLYRMCPILAEEFSDVFPELKAQVDFVVKVILEEEKSFLRTLELGLKRIENLEVQNNIISGQQSFELFDTYGFPIDLTLLLAREKGWQVDETGFDAALQEQKARSRKDAVKEVGDWNILRDDPNVQFLGYDQLELRDAHVTKYRTVMLKGQPQYQLVLNRTPFYPEGGGQVGDTGWMSFSDEKIKVLDTKKENTLVIHIVEKLPHFIQDPSVHCNVDAPKRRLTESNHSATHLMHAALRKVLGTHVQQKGSYLDDQTLRFDFQHFQKLTDAELAEIEQIVNEKIREDILLEEARSLPIEEAKKSGAMMLFGEKYGDTVRMITFDPGFSRELCGGCHVRRTGNIGFFKITGESAIAAGVRRIEAVTAVAAEAYVRNLVAEMEDIKQSLKTKDLLSGILKLQEERKRQEKQYENLLQLQASKYFDGIIEQIDDLASTKGVKLITQHIDIQDNNIIKTLAHNLEQRFKPTIVLLGSIIGDKAFLSIRVSDELIKKSPKYYAGHLVNELSKAYLDGRGGGKPSFAEGSGPNTKGLGEALNALINYIPDPGDTPSLPTKIIAQTKVESTKFAQKIFKDFILEPYKNHPKTDLWDKGSTFQRIEVLKRGQADFTKPFEDEESKLSLPVDDLIILYCYYYMQMHYDSSLITFRVATKFLHDKFLLDKDLLFIDFGCGPFTSGAAFMDFYKNNVKGDEDLRIYYTGIDHAQEMLDKANQVSMGARNMIPVNPDSVFKFSRHDKDVLKDIKNFKTSFKKHEKSAIIINLCYLLASESFNLKEKITQFAELIAEISNEFPNDSICLIYQNPVRVDLHKNWEKLKQFLKLSKFGNIHERIGVVHFSFKDEVGSWSRPNPDLKFYFEYFYNENV